MVCQSDDKGSSHGGARLAILEPMRGIAALWVFAFHYHFSESFQGAFPRLHQLLKVGDLGVPMFFVISGYCITASARSSIRNNEPLNRFLYRRMRRIYPPFWCSLAVVAAIPFVIEALSSIKTGRYVPPPTENLNYGYMRYGLLDWLMVGSLGQVFRPIANAENLQGKFTSINAVYWTLAIEVQFYLTTALALTARRKFYWIMLTVTAVSIPCLLIRSSYTWGIFLPYWPMFAIGVCLHWSFEQGFRLSKFQKVVMPLACVVAPGLVIAFATHILRAGTIGWLWFALGFGLFLIVVEGIDRRLGEDRQRNRNKATRLAFGLLVTLGAMSYSLYLVHGRLQFLVMQPVRQILPVDGVAFDLAVMALTTLACYVFYRMCEKPFMKNPRRSPPSTLVRINFSE